MPSPFSGSAMAGLLGPMGGAFPPNPTESARPSGPTARPRVTGYHADVFDMSSDDRRGKYCSTMEEIMRLVGASSAVLVKNDLQVLPGSGWWRYVEWFTYDMARPVDGKAPDRSDK